MSRTEYATLHLPEHRLRDCVHMAVERDTRGVRLNDAERFSYYPATPFPTISWILAGQLQMVDAGAAKHGPQLGDPLPRVTFSGPTRKPSASWSPSSVHVLTVSFYPEALARLLKTSIPNYVGSILPLENVLPADGPQQLLTVTFDDRTSPFLQIQNLLDGLWDNAAAQHSSDVRAWLARLPTSTPSITDSAGQRQLQRRIKGWTGQSMRDLQLYARVEAAMSHAETLGEDGLDLAAVAAEAGFSDQSHLGRDVRRVTGLSPARLNDLVREDEAFWMYRLLR